MQICRQCGAEFAPYPVIDGIKVNLHGRRRCLECLPLRRLRGPRRKVVRPQKMKTCVNCGAQFPTRMVIDGIVRNLKTRRFCLDCSPFGMHNTAKMPPGAMSVAALLEHRRRKRNAKTYRYQKKRRKSVKAFLIAERGGRCEDCGYNDHPNALEFHHLDPSTKEFTISRYIAQWDLDRLRAEAAKCVLLCANCHAVRHATASAERESWPIVDLRRELKLRAVAFMGDACVSCGRGGPVAVFQFHHLDPTSKEFGIGEDGKVRSWTLIAAELAKCVMLCANCHREVHAGVREIQPKLAEDANAYVA